MKYLLTVQQYRSNFLLIIKSSSIFTALSLHLGGKWRPTRSHLTQMKQNFAFLYMAWVLVVSCYHASQDFYPMAIYDCFMPFSLPNLAKPNHEHKGIFPRTKILQSLLHHCSIYNGSVTTQPWLTHIRFSPRH